MVKKFDLQEDKIVVETRSLVDSLDLVRERLESLGAKKGKTEEIIDEHYGDLKGVVPTKHTYEKIGKAARVRRTTLDGKTSIEAVVKEGIRKGSDGVFSHDAVRSEILVTGGVSKLDAARELLKKQGFPELITVIRKKRENYWLDEVSVCLDLVKGFGPAMEIRAVAKNESQIARVKKAEIKLIKELGVEERDILDTSMTHLIISSRIKSDPKVKVPYLEKEIQRLEKELREKLKRSNVEYKESGDDWHDNPVWDALMNEVEVLKARIREIKKELIKIKGKD